MCGGGPSIVGTTLATSFTWLAWVDSRPLAIIRPSGALRLVKYSTSTGPRGFPRTGALPVAKRTGTRSPSRLSGRVMATGGHGPMNTGRRLGSMVGLPGAGGAGGGSPFSFASAVST